MRILATGCPSSGTRYLTRLLAAGGADAVHLSQPDQAVLIDGLGLTTKRGEHPDHLAAWFDMDKALEEFDAIVIVIRGALGHLGSYKVHWAGMTDDAAELWRQQSFAMLAPAFGNSKVTVVTYESLAVRDERVWLLSHLGLDPAGADLEPWVDMNSKHYGQTFEWWGRVLTYCNNPYNNSRLNERAVEIPIVQSWLSDRSGHGLEVGNVLSHYGVDGHRVVDLTENAQGVDNIDVFKIEGKYDWIIAISTLEHVRWDGVDGPRDSDGAMSALEHLLSLLDDGGSLIATVPTGYHAELDRAIVSRSMGATRDCTFSRSATDANAWMQDERPVARPYGKRTPWAESVWIGEFER